MDGRRFVVPVIRSLVLAVVCKVAFPKRNVVWGFPVIRPAALQVVLATRIVRVVAASMAPVHPNVPVSHPAVALVRHRVEMVAAAVVQVGVLRQPNALTGCILIMLHASVLHFQVVLVPPAAAVVNIPAQRIVRHMIIS